MFVVSGYSLPMATFVYVLALAGVPYRYKEVVENVFRYKDSKEKNIRRAVIHLLPRMAAFSPERFASGEGGGREVGAEDGSNAAWELAVDGEC